MQRTWVKIFRKKKKNLESVFLRPVAVGSELHPFGSKLKTLGVSRWRRAGHHIARACGLDRGWTCVCACVRGWRGWHTHAAPLSADSENMFAWDKSTKTHPSTGSKYALRHCWHGVNNLTLTEVGEARGKMETVTEREMDWTVIDIQFELLQIFPFSTKWSTLWSARCRTTESDFSVLCTEMVWSEQNNLCPCGRNVKKCNISAHDLVPTSEHCFRTK